MSETYDPDAFREAWGATETRAIQNKATAVADFMGFFREDSECELILPEGTLTIADLETCGLSIVHDVNDKLLRELKREPNQLHSLGGRERTGSIAIGNRYGCQNTLERRS